MIILGIDPGTAIMGFGVIDFEKGKYKTLEWGAIRTPKEDRMEIRLKALFYGVMDLIDKYRPKVMAIEQLFFNTNQTTAITVGQARGVALLAAAIKGVEVAEYTPLQVKQTMVGYGRADKIQIQTMVKNMLGLKEIPKPDDAADALAIAICYCQFGGQKSWRSTDISVNALDIEERLLSRSKDYKIFKPKDK